MSGLLEIQVLGGLTIKRNNARLTRFETRKIEALLVYLAFTAHAHSREFLGEFLWDDRSQEQSLGNLRVLLHRVRQSVDLETTRRTVSLVPPFWIDAREVSERLAAAETELARAADFSPEMITSVEYALSLYQGDFLAGFYVADARNFDDWMFFEREQLRLRVIKLADRLVQTYLAHRATLDGIRVAQRLLQFDPLQEATHRYLMRLYAGAGQTGAAVSQYETCKRLLAEELQAAPSAETEAIFAELVGNLAPQPRPLPGARHVVEREGRAADDAPVAVGEQGGKAGGKAVFGLPAQSTPFVGREGELAELAELLAEPAVRLISIVGAGGMGKTRLALESAAQAVGQFADGAYFVNLAPLNSAEFVPSAVAEAIGIELHQGLELRRQLLDYLREKRLLIVLDNFEHVLEAADLVSEMLQTAPGIRALTTSRERLNIDGERLFHVEGMDFPNWQIPDNILEYSAFRLFLESARRIRPDFVLKADDLIFLARICQQVAGMPLGILLASSWVEVLSLAEISDEIAHNADFLETRKRDAPPRQHSMRALFGYSWGLLTEDERRVYAKLSVFRGGFTREATQTVACASIHTLRGLVNKSMLRRDPAGRYDVHELLRQYAAEALSRQPEQERAALDSHCAYHAEFVAERTARLFGADQVQALAELDGERVNIQTAWLYAAIGRRERELCLMTIDLLYYFRVKGIDGEPLFRQALERLKADRQPEDLSFALLLLALGRTYLNAHKSADAGPLLHHSLSILRGHGYARATAKALQACGNLDRDLDKDRRLTLALYEESVAIFRALDNPAETSDALNDMAWSLRGMGKIAEARQVLNEAIIYARQSGAPERIINVLALLGRIDDIEGRYADAEAAFQEVLNVLPELNSQATNANVWQLWGGVAYTKGDYGEATRRWEEASRLFQENGDRFMAAQMSANIALAEHDQGNDIDARRRLLEVVALYRKEGLWLCSMLINLGYPTAALGRYAEAEGYLREALGLAVQVETVNNQIEAIIGLANLLAAAGRTEQAVEWLAMTMAHPRMVKELKRVAERSLIRVQSQLPVDVFAAAVDRGEALDLDTVVAECLNGERFFLPDQQGALPEKLARSRK